jgi:hypothetical protein
MTSATWKEFCTAQNFFQFLHGSSQYGLEWSLKVSIVMLVQHVLICEATCTTIFILSLTESNLVFLSLSIFHSLSVKFVLVYNKIWSLWSKSTCVEGNQIIKPGCLSIKCFTYENIMVTVLQWSFFGALVRHGRDKIHSLGYCNTKTHKVQS